jgi:hypothetical protein
MREVIDLSSVRQRPWLVDHLPGISAGSGTAIYPYVYVGRELYRNVRSANPDPRYIALIIHEQVHIKRIKAYGPAKWYWQYFLRPGFRLEEELLAYGRQFEHLKIAGLTYDLELCAQRLSGFIYLWSTSRGHALARLRALWQET